MCARDQADLPSAPHFVTAHPRDQTTGECHDNHPDDPPAQNAQSTCNICGQGRPLTSPISCEPAPNSTLCRPPANPVEENLVKTRLACFHTHTEPSSHHRAGQHDRLLTPEYAPARSARRAAEDQSVRCEVLCLCMRPLKSAHLAQQAACASGPLDQYRRTLAPFFQTAEDLSPAAEWPLANRSNDRPPQHPTAFQPSFYAAAPQRFSAACGG